MCAGFSEEYLFITFVGEVFTTEYTRPGYGFRTVYRSVVCRGRRRLHSVNLGKMSKSLTPDLSNLVYEFKGVTYSPFQFLPSFEHEN